jgi:hypothetical protein
MMGAIATSQNGNTAGYDTGVVGRAVASGGAPASEVLSPQDAAYFELFGFLHLPGFFRDQIGAIDAAFEEAFASDVEKLHSIQRVHEHQERWIIPNVTEQHEVLGRLPRDPRVHAIAERLIGPSYEFAGSDANLYYCDTLWHSDTWQSPLRQLHVKFSLYLDPVDADSGAIRVIPGSHFMKGAFSRTLRAGLRDPTQAESAFGVPSEQLPGVTVASEPGDVIIWNYRIVHAAFNGPARRRHVSFGFRELPSGGADAASG